MAISEKRSVDSARRRRPLLRAVGGDGDDLHPVQEGFWECHGLQCGFCTPGMIMSSVALLDSNDAPSEDEIRHGIEGNLCRCTGYHNIVRSVQYASAKIRGEEPIGASSEVSS